METEKEIKEVRVSIPVTQYNALLMISEHFNEQIERLHKDYEDTINKLNTDRERLLRMYREVKDEANKTWDENRELTQKLYEVCDYKPIVEKLVTIVKENPMVFAPYSDSNSHCLAAVLNLLQNQIK